jgi:large subunit ribosomal protein L4
MKLEVVNIAGEKTGRQVELNDAIFGIEPNNHAVYLTVKQYLANQRQGTHKSKERSEITGSTRKMHRQKGTGGARKGDIKNPLYHGGGTIFGPRPRNYSFKLNKKLKELAKRSALSHKAANNGIIVVEDFSFEKPSTAQFAGMLKNLGVTGARALLVMPASDRNVVLSGRNIQRTEVIQATDLNTYTVMKANRLIVTEKAVQAINEQVEK